MNDNLVLNFLERWTSADFNNGQAMTQRVMSELAHWVHAAHNEPIGAHSAVPRNWCAGLSLSSDGGNNAGLDPGVLGQYSTTWPSAPSGLDTPFRIGVNRSPLVVTLPIDGSPQYWLLEARVKDVITSTESRDVFNPSTQTFAPTSVTKRIERAVETHWVGPSAGSWPAPTGDPWVTIAVYRTPGTGAAAPLDTTQLTDLRPQALDGVDSAAPGAQSDDGIWFDASMATHRKFGAAADTKKMQARFRGKVGGCNLYLMSAIGATGIVPIPAVGFADANQLVALYLCPLRAAGAKIIPRSAPAARVAQGGVFVVSTAEPTLGRTNSSSITLPAPYSNWNGGVIPAGDALYMGSVYNSAGGDFFPLTQTQGGQAHDTVPLIGPQGGTTDGVTGQFTTTFDLRGELPQYAKSVRLLIQASWSAAGANKQFEIKVFPTGTTTTIAQIDGHAEMLSIGATVDVPCGGFDDSDGAQVFDLRAALTPVSGTHPVDMFVTVIGWEM